MKASLALLSILAALLPALRGDEPNPSPSVDDGFHFADILPRSLQKNPRLNLSILTEVTPAGKAITLPDRNHPAYYIAVDGGMGEEGDVIAGEIPPSADKWRKVMIASLAASGYLSASDQHPATLIIHCRYGSFNSVRPIGGTVPISGSVLDNPIALNSLQLDALQFRNLIYKAALVGGEKFAVDMARAMNTGTLTFFRDRDAQTDTLVDLAFGDLYFVIASAYDYNAATHGEQKLLWRTKISTDSHGLMMDDAVPALTADAREYFGHPTDGPVVFHPRMFSSQVILGEPVVKGYIENPRPPAATSAGKP